jgi:hypothetical protein
LNLSAIEDRNDRIVLKACHNGYLRLPGRNLHCREWIWERGCLTIRDEITGPWSNAEARYHFHPDIKIDDKSIKNNRISLILRQGKEIEMIVDDAEIYLEKDFWHPHFGTSIASICLVAAFKAPFITTFIEWRNNN